MKARRSDTARREAVRRWEAAGRPPCGICGTPIAEGEPTHADHIILRAMGGSDDPANLRMVHALCNIARNGTSMTLVQLLVARQFGLVSFKATDRLSAHCGRHIDVRASFRQGRLTDCTRSLSPAVWLSRWRNAAAVDRYMSRSLARRASSPERLADLP